MVFMVSGLPVIACHVGYAVDPADLQIMDPATVKRVSSPMRLVLGLSAQLYKGSRYWYRPY